ncbi:MAG: dihydrolipoamide acetyltransferase family protein [Rubrobacteraceae bacterium]
MTKPVTMPQLGESVTEGTIARWLKAEGDEVEIDEPLCEIDTDKVSADLPSPFAGTLEEVLISEGTTVDVGTEIALMTVPGEQNGSPGGKAPAREDAYSEAPTEEFTSTETGVQSVATAGVPYAAARSGSNGSGDMASAETLRSTRSSPVVRRLAAEHQLDIQEISGTGIEGRVTKKDIEQYIKARESAPKFSPKLEPAEHERVRVYEGDRALELTSIRRAIAERMSASKREAPHAWTMVEVDVSGLVGVRERMKREFVEREGVRLTYLPFIAKAAVEGLKEYPILNSAWGGDRIVLRKRINVGIAVDLDDALIVPVIHDADELNLLGLARKIDELVKKARNGALSPEDVAGGTFTVNNPGALGSVISTPIINHPQAAILSAEAIVKRPVVVNDAIAIRSMMNLEVSFDHRILDGGVALRYLNFIKKRLESYTLESKIS